MISLVGGASLYEIFGGWSCMKNMSNFILISCQISF